MTRTQRPQVTTDIIGQYETTGEEHGRPTEEEKAAKALKAAEQRTRNAQRREEKAAQREQEKADRIAAYLTDNPIAKAVHDFESDADDTSYAARTLRDLRNALLKYGSLTERQLPFAEKLLAEHAQKQTK